MKDFLKAFWKTIKPLLFVFSLFFFGGLGFALGVANSKPYNDLINGRMLIITSIDRSLVADEEENESHH